MNGVFFFYRSTDLSINLFFGLVSLGLLWNLFSLIYYLFFIMFHRQNFTCWWVVYCLLFALSFFLFTVWVITTTWWSASWRQSLSITKGIWLITAISMVKNIISTAADNFLWFWLAVVFYESTLTVLNDSEEFSFLVLFVCCWFSAKFLF